MGEQFQNHRQGKEKGYGKDQERPKRSFVVEGVCH
jgi:hypothetical protein